MVSFATLLNPMQTLPLLLKHADIKVITKAASAFIWSSKRPCMAFRKLYLPKRDGSVGWPDIRLYIISLV